MAGTLAPTIPTIGQPNSTEDSDVRESLITLRDGLNAILNSSNKVDPSLFLEADRPRVKWYTPKIISTAQSTGSLTPTLLGTADEIPGVVVPANGLVQVGYRALAKVSGAGITGKAALYFNNSNPREYLDEDELEATWTSTSNHPIITDGDELRYANAENSGDNLVVGMLPFTSFLTIMIEPGTYNISIKYFVSGAGTLTASNRRLYVITYG